jgi:aspartyl-tRNA(Asn)/glutamyl-tRNA(Gln) amidotransferase subunit C
MALNEAEVNHIAELARLHLTDAEKAMYREQLSSILAHVARLQALDTADIPPTSSVLPPQTVLRVDEPQPGLSLEELLENAPHTEGRQFRVPPVLDDFSTE